MIPRPKRIFYGWWIVGAASVVQLLNVGLLFHGFGAYVLHLQAEFGWSRAAISGAFAMARTESGILGPVQGWLIDRHGPRASMFAGFVLFGAGFVCLSRMDSILALYLSFALLALGSSLAGFLPIATTVNNWFIRRRASALGLTLAGGSAGGLLVPLVVWSLSSYGWRPTAFASGVLLWVVGLPITRLMRHRPEAYGQVPDGGEPADRSGDETGQAHTEARNRAAAEPAFTARQAIRTRAFWYLSIAHGAALLVVGTVLLHQVPHMVEGIGLSEERAALIVALLVAVSVVGQLGGGYLGDRIDKRLGVFACLWMHTAALAIFAVASSELGAVVFAVLHGIAWGVRGPLINAMRADFFGRASYATISGYASLILMVGMTAGPLFAGFAHDVAGDYRAAFLILALLTALGSGTILLARPPLDPAAAGPPEGR